ncbi:unnamed protein product [Closterium sp. NIES-53]
MDSVADSTRRGSQQILNAGVAGVQTHHLGSHLLSTLTPTTLANAWIIESTYNLQWSRDLASLRSSVPRGFTFRT